MLVRLLLWLKFRQLLRTDSRGQLGSDFVRSICLSLDQFLVRSDVACFLRFPGNAGMDHQVPSSGWVPLARRTRYRYANLPSGPAIDSNRNMRCAALGRSMKGLLTRCSQHQVPHRWDSADYPKRAIYNLECPELRLARRACRRGPYIARTPRCRP